MKTSFFTFEKKILNPSTSEMSLLNETLSA